jgi:hypothetical protein
LVLKYGYHIIILLCAFTSKAQSHYEIFKPIDTINAILYKNPTVFFVENGEMIRGIKKVQANQYGKIIIVNTSNKEIDTVSIKTAPKKKVFLDLFKFETIEIFGSQILFKDENNKQYRAFYGFNNKDLLKFKNQIEILKASCTKNWALNYIKDDYSSFKTGYDLDGEYKVISENYKASFADSIFTLTFDTFDENIVIQKQTITINLKDVITLSPNGADTVEINDYVAYALPICGKLAFATTNESYEINIYYKVDNDVEQTEIYKAFEDLMKSYKKTRINRSTK